MVRSFGAVSKWRNALLDPAKPGSRHEELGLASGLTSSSSTDLTGGSLIRASHSTVVVRSSSNSLVCLPSTGTLDEGLRGRYAKRPPTITAANGGSLTDFDIEPFEENPRLALAGSDGSITLQKLPSFESTGSFPPTLFGSSDVVATFPSSHQSPITSLRFHPTTGSLLLAASTAAVEVWDLDSGKAAISLDAKGQQNYASAWSWDGKLVGSTAKDGLLRIWDPRAGTEAIASVLCHAGKAKPSRLTFVAPGSSNVVTTGFGSMREREWALWDARSLTSSPLKRVSLDPAPGLLEPLADPDRGMVYMVAKGESNVRWADLGISTSRDSSADGVFQLPFVSAAAVIAPPSVCDTMKGEISRVFFLTPPGSGPHGDAVVPTAVKIPRRQYIDFHPDLYPDTWDLRAPSQGVKKWLAGEDKTPQLVSQDPARKKEMGPAATRAETKGSEGPAPAPATARAPAPAVVTTTTPAANAPAQPAAPAKDVEPAKPRDALSSAPAVAAAALATAPASSLAQPSRSQPATTSASTPAPAARKSVAKSGAVTPRWSRRFLAGVTPLIPAYQNLSTLDVSRSPDARMLFANARYLFFPVAGPGGRLGVQLAASHGRMPSPTPAFSNGATMGDFVGDPFEDGKVFTAAEDGRLRLWEVPEVNQDGELEADLGEPRAVWDLDQDGTSARVAELVMHPLASGLVAAAPGDADGALKLIDTSAADGKIAKSISVPGGGSFSLSWSPDGHLVALCGKDKKLRIVDLRRQEGGAVLAETSAHSSVRSFRAVWLDQSYLVTAGHGMGSTRELILFHLSSSDGEGKLVKKTSMSLDVSPAVLFPHWDADTSVLWLWSKGERGVSTFEIHPEDKEPILALPVFQHATPQLGLSFLHKTHVDVKEVEIAHSVRLCKGEAQRVGWEIARKRKEFFQDDVFPPTPARVATLSAREWLEGGQGTQRFADLRPQGLELLSEAPAVVYQSSLPKGPIRREETDEERRERLLDDAFAKAKIEDEEERPQAGAAAKRAPDNDDWDSD